MILLKLYATSYQHICCLLHCISCQINADLIVNKLMVCAQT